MKKMIRNIGMVAMAAGMLANVSCKDVKEEEPAPPMQHEMQAPDTTMQEQGDMGMQQSNAEFQVENAAVAYSHYIDIKNALVQSDAKKASTLAKSMLGKLEGTDVDSKIPEAAQQIAGSEDINQQREAFSKLTKVMEPVLTTAINSGEIYKQYCPMAFEGKGDYWFSDSKEIRNPYFGDKMLTCGRVDAIITQ